MGQLLYLVIHQRDVRRIHGDVAAHAAHGDAHLCSFQSGGVVDAVADHAHRLSGRLIPVDGCQLILRQAVSAHRPDPQPSGDRLGGVFMVAGKQHRLDPKAVQGADHIRALLAQGVGEDEITRKHVVHSQIDDRAARLQRLLRRRRGRHANTVLIQQLGVACQHLFPFYTGAHAPAGAHIKVTGRRRLLPQFLFAAAHNRLAQRMF